MRRGVEETTAMDRKRGHVTRLALDAQQMQQLWATWRTDPWLQSIRAVLHRACSNDIDISCHASRSADPIQNDEVLHGIREILMHNLPSVIDWICVAGVCPVGVGSDYLLSMTEDERLSGPTGPTLAYVPAYENVRVYRLLRKRMPTAYACHWDDALVPPKEVSRAHRPSGRDSGDDADEAENMGELKLSEGSGERESEEDSYDLCAFVPNHTAERADASPCSVLTAAFRTLQDMAVLESTYSKSNLQRMTTHVVAENQQTTAIHRDSADWIVPGVANDVAAQMDRESTDMANTGLLAQHTAMQAMQDNAHGVYEIPHPFDRHMRVMPMGQKLTTLPPVPGAMGVIETREHLLHQLCKCFGVPPSSIGMTKPESQQGGGNAKTRQMDIENYESIMWEQTKDGWCRVFSDWLTFVIGILVQRSASSEGGWLQTLAQTSSSIIVKVSCDRAELPVEKSVDPAHVFLARTIGAISDAEEIHLLRNCVGLAYDQAAAHSDHEGMSESSKATAMRERVLQSAYVLQTDKESASPK